MAPETGAETTGKGVVKPGAVAETVGNDSETGSVVGVEVTGVAVVGVGRPVCEAW